MFDRMLVAIDSSPYSGTVLAAASDLAVRSHATVLVAHIRDVSVPVAMAASAGRPGALAGRPGAPSLEDEEIANQLVRDGVNKLRTAGVEARGEVSAGWGATARELLKLADEFDANIIVVGSHGSHMSQIVLGSVAYRVVHQARCPVLVVRW